MEANGEKLGYLPGDIDEKTFPFMMSYYYNMEQFINKQQLDVLLNENVIQVIPLAYMRGLTLANKIVILDESQNALPEQIKMFLTRFGQDSKYIICGDLDQTDRKETNGLEDSVRRFDRLRGVGFHRFTKADIVRHEIVGRLLDRYEDEYYKGESKNSSILSKTEETLSMIKKRLLLLRKSDLFAEVDKRTTNSGSAWS